MARATLWRRTTPQVLRAACGFISLPESSGRGQSEAFLASDWLFYFLIFLFEDKSAPFLGKFSTKQTISSTNAFAIRGIALLYAGVMQT